MERERKRMRKRKIKRERDHNVYYIVTFRWKLYLQNFLRGTTIQIENN